MLKEHSGVRMDDFPARHAAAALPGRVQGDHRNRAIAA